jgi:hypothetical protein
VSNRQEKTLEEQLADAEARCEELEDEVADAEDALSDARANLREAEEERDAIEEKIGAPEREAEEREMAALVAAQTGPQKPIGNRVVRSCCAISEIPDWVAAMHHSKTLVAVSHKGRVFVSNNYMAIAVDSADEVEMLPSNADKAFMTRGRRLVREDAPIDEGEFWVRSFGVPGVQLRLAALVEDLFPGCVWHSCGGELDPLHALVDGVLVAVVMPVRRSRVAA